MCAAGIGRSARPPPLPALLALHVALAVRCATLHALHARTARPSDARVRPRALANTQRGRPAAGIQQMNLLFVFWVLNRIICFETVRTVSVDSIWLGFARGSRGINSQPMSLDFE